MNWLMSPNWGFIAPWSACFALLVWVLVLRNSVSRLSASVYQLLRMAERRSMDIQSIEDRLVLMEQPAILQKRRKRRKLEPPIPAIKDCEPKRVIEV